MSAASWGKIHNVLVSCSALQYYRVYVNDALKSFCARADESGGCSVASRDARY